jgi:hypothetical protein
VPIIILTILWRKAFAVMCITIKLLNFSALKLVISFIGFLAEQLEDLNEEKS